MSLSKHRRRSAARRRRRKAAVRRAVAMRVKHDLLRTEVRDDFHPSAAKHFGAVFDTLVFKYLTQRAPVLHVTCT